MKNKCWIICKDKAPFEEIGNYNYCNLEDMILPDVIAIDLETEGLRARQHNIFCAQIGTKKNNYLIKMYDNNYTFSDLIPYIKGKTLVFHNSLFDLGFMFRAGFYPKNVKDTFLASKIIYNGDYQNIRHDLGTVFERELELRIDKYEQKNIHIVKLSQPSTIQYSFNDVDRLLELHDELENKIERGGYTLTYNLHCRAIRALAYMEQCGMPLSSKLWSEKMAVDKENVKKYSCEIEEFIYENLPQFRDRQLDLFNDSKSISVSITSPKQMISVFNAFGINTKDKDDKDTINDNVISKSDHPFVNLWLKFQKANHRVTTFGENIFKQIEDERIYTNFNPAVDTARLSTRQGGINFLNFPADKETRTCFECDSDSTMVVSDWSGQENVIVADLSGDEAMTKSVVDGDDLHWMFAQVMNVELNGVEFDSSNKEHKASRQAAKSPRFAFAYGGSAFTIHQNEGTPLARAEEIEKAFKELHHGIFTWGAEVLRVSIDNGYIESADGWKLKLPRYDVFCMLRNKIQNITREQWTVYKTGKIEHKKWVEAKEAGREYVTTKQFALDFYHANRKDVSGFFKIKSEYQRLALNNPVQARGSHMLKHALATLFEWIEDNKLLWSVLICNAPHDEICLEAPVALGEIVRSNLERIMVETGNFYLNDLTIKADAKCGQSWGHAK